ncbi:carboxymuconolactone decarboxylase family protein [Novosphingobium aquimarinum]|uniref:carboxymuconolactone decarboxylase family protein n=1 Tax=Novosphingobium aquimarinum TaxID=2682494 RepID=UPI0018DD6966|nr:carboxymuconolactone decarboxylase family protein [Novosphingobium aquimarinum]
MIRIDIPDEHGHDPYSYASANHAREIMAAASDFSKAVYTRSQLSLREFEGARSRTAQINGCIICQQFRAARDAPAMFSATGTRPDHLVSDNGPAPDEAFYEAVSDWRTSPVFSTRERLAIEFAERFAEEPKVLAADEDFWTRTKAEFSDGEIVDLAHSVASWVGLGRVAHVLGFDSVCLPFAQPETEAA